MKKRRNGSLWILYLYQIFQRMNNILFISAVVVVTLGLFFMANPWYDKDAYSMAEEGFYTAYFTKALFLLMVSNGILSAALVISLGWDSRSLDIFLLSRFKRRSILVSKIIALTVVLALISLYEFFILYLFPYLLYPKFSFGIKDMLSILYIFLSFAFWTFLSFSLTLALTSFFTPLFVLVTDVLVHLLAQAFSDISDSLSIILPIIRYEDGICSMDSLFVVPLFLVLFIGFAFFIYEITDLRGE